jgi:hypothetical protein
VDQVRSTLDGDSSDLPRFFVNIPEANHLAPQSTFIEEGVEIFLLTMGGGLKLAIWQRKRSGSNADRPERLYFYAALFVRNGGQASV